MNNLEEKKCSISFHNSLTKRKPVTITFESLVYSVRDLKGPGKREILRSVSGEFEPGSLTAIMGSSGAGKSTLMDILAGFKPAVEGCVKVNNVTRNLNKFRKMSCYIMQRDELCPYLSVTEAMEFATNIKLEDKITREEKTVLISEILENLGLSHAADTRSSGLSGGERKRLAIALELINNPPVMFFDEPTSGLDSSSCLQCISLLKTLAQGGRTVICIIHQPSSSIFKMFDHLFLMAEGQCIYQGSPSSLVDFLSTSVGFFCPNHYNPADFALEVAVGKYGEVVEKLVEAAEERRCAASVEKKEAMLSMEHPGVGLDDCDEGEIALFNDGASFWWQFGLLYKRSLVCTTRDMTLTHLRFVVHILLGLLVGMLYFGIGNEATKVISNMAHLFFNLLFITFTAKMATVLTFPLELPVLIREHLNNWYSLKAYFLAKSTADLPFEVIYTTIYLAIVYLMTNQPYDGSRFFMFWLTGLMTSFVAQSIGLAIGIAFQIEVGVLAGPVSMALPVLFSGYLVSVDTVPIYLRWVCYTVYLKYGLQTTVTSIYGYERVKLNCSQPYCIFRSPSVVLEDFSIGESVFMVDMLILGAYFIAVRMLAYCFLWQKLRSKY